MELGLEGFVNPNPIHPTASTVAVMKMFDSWIAQESENREDPIEKICCLCMEAFGGGGGGGGFL